MWTFRSVSLKTDLFKLCVLQSIACLFRQNPNLTLWVYQNAEFLLIKTLIHTDTLFGLCLVCQHSPYPLSFKHTPLKTACSRLIKKAFIAKRCTQGGSIYQTTKPEVITVCFRTHLQYMCLCWTAVWCCMLGFPLNLGRTINSPFDSIITVQRIFFHFIGTLGVFRIFSKLDAVFFSFIPVNDSDLLKICLRGCQADGLLLLIAERPKRSNRFWTDIFSVVNVLRNLGILCTV